MSTPVIAPAMADERSPRILVVRLGALGDILHTLPAVANLKRSLPAAHLTWLVEPRWAPLLEGNPWVDEAALLRRDSILAAWRSAKALRPGRFHMAIDFQGLLKSALPAWLAWPERILGFARDELREKEASWFYTESVASTSTHVVERALDLAAAAGAQRRERVFPIPPGKQEGCIPGEPFVLSSPLAGWGAKQWPLPNYAELARLLGKQGLALVVNGPPDSEPALRAVPGAYVHVSGLPGLIHATRRAAAVVGLDSGPMHLAAALDVPGVAIFGPTDPARNGPYSPRITVLRAPGAVTSYARRREPGESMRAISPEQVASALLARLAKVSS